jgi:uncharacterized membrane protein
MAFLFPYLLFLHVMGAVLAFGPTYAYSFIGGMGGKEPQHANFGLRAIGRIGTGLVYPLAILQGVTGLALILTGSIDPTAHAWLAIGIGLYLIALVYSLTVQRSALHHAIELTSAPPPAGAPPGPPPGLPATAKKIQRGGMFLGVAIAVIVFMMVVKPGG